MLANPLSIVREPPRCVWCGSGGRRNGEDPQVEYTTGVRNEARYTGGEWNSVIKDWDQTSVKVALAYPDVHGVGMPNLGLMVLYDPAHRAEGRTGRTRPGWTWSSP